MQTEEAAHDLVLQTLLEQVRIAFKNYEHFSSGKFQETTEHAATSEIARTIGALQARYSGMCTITFRGHGNSEEVVCVGHLSLHDQFPALIPKWENKRVIHPREVRSIDLVRD